MTPKFKEGDIIRHFKRDLIYENEKVTNKFLYKVIAIATDTETEEQVLVYQALYSPFKYFVRPLKDAHEVVRGTEKYKEYGDDIQKYRLEVCNDMFIK